MPHHALRRRKITLDDTIPDHTSTSIITAPSPVPKVVYPSPALVLTAEVTADE
jgi:hypothetical protein